MIINNNISAINAQRTLKFRNVDLAKDMSALSSVLRINRDGEDASVLAVYEMDELKNALQKIYDGTDNLRPWENKDPMAIVNLIDNFIQENHRYIFARISKNHFICA